MKALTKRFLSATLSVCLMLTLITPSFAASTEETNKTYEVPPIPTTGDVWDGTTLQPSKLVRIDGKYYYEISKCSELAYVAQTGEDWLTYSYVLANNLIINDIELAIDEDGTVSYSTDKEILNWTPIGSFTGTFDGAGYSISGVLGCNYFFYGLSGTLKNLSIVNSFFSGWEDLSGIVRSLSGTMENCAFSGCCKGKQAGGMAAVVYSSDGDAKIASCINYGLIVGTKYKYPDDFRYYCVGGITGEMDNSKVENCINYGLITDGLLSGGIVGYANHGKVTDCVNHGNVSSIRGNGGGFSGGIIGFLVTRRYNNRVINNINYGNICAESTAGGIVGCTTPQYSDDGENIKSCNNYGKVESTSDTASVGGIVGKMYGSCTECHNWGEIIGGGFTGGIVGEICSNNGECSYTANYGNVTGYGASGGIAGGLYGYKVGIIDFSCNLGNVEGATYVGGIFGGYENYKKEGMTISNCYNTGAVSGESYVGGISGYGKYCSIIHCYNVGKVDATEKCAMITPETNYLWEYCTVSNVYYLENSDLTGFDNSDDMVDIVEAKSSEELKKEETFVNWNFDEIWVIATNINNGYPYLQWQKPCATGHSTTHFDAVSPTYDAGGNIEYWYCSGCKKYFSDAACTEELADVTLPPRDPDVTAALSEDGILTITGILSENTTTPNIVFLAVYQSGQMLLVKDISSLPQNDLRIVFNNMQRADTVKIFRLGSDLAPRFAMFSIQLTK